MSEESMTYEEKVEYLRKLQELKRLRDLKAQRRAELARTMTHPSTPPVVPTRTPPSDFDPQASLSQWQSFQAGRTRGNAEEIQAQLGGSITEDPQGNLYWRPEGEERSIAVNPPGLDWNDPARILGEEVFSSLGAAGLTLAGGTSIPGLLGRAMLGAFLGSGTNEAVQFAEGTQRDTAADIAKQMAADAAFEGVGAGLGIGISALGGPVRAGSDYAQNQLERAIRFANEPEGVYPQPLAADITDVVGIGPAPAPVARGLSRQAEASTGRLGDIRTDRAIDIQRAIEGEFLLPPQGREAAEEALSRSARRQRLGLQREAAGRGPGKEAGSYRMTTGAKEAGERARGRVSEQYQGPLASALREEQPVFDLGPAQRSWNAPTLSRAKMVDTGLVDIDGNPIMDRVIEQVEAIPEATGKIAYLKRFLSTLEPEQTNFEAIKRVRTEVGSMLGEKAFRDQAEKAGRRFYGELTEVLTNPKNAASTPRYLQEFESANLLEQWRQGMMSDDSVKQALRGKGGANLLRNFASDPDTFITPEFRRLMDLAPKNDRSMVKGAMQRAILDSDDPARTVKGMRGFTGSDSYNYLFDTPAEQNAFESLARRVTRFNNSTLGQTLDREEKGFETLKFAMGSLSDRTQARSFWNNLDTRGKEQTQLALIDNAVDSSIAPDAQGIMRVDTKALDGNIADMRRNGTWSFLTEKQQERLQDMNAYYRVVVNKGKDVGTSLETASLIADIKKIIQVADPVAMRQGFGAVQTLWHNKLLAGYLSDPARANRLINRVVKEPRDRKTWAAGTVLGAPFAWDLLETGYEEFEQ